MERALAARILDQLHRAQNEFFAVGATTRLRAILCPDVCWTVPGRHALAGAYSGSDAVLTYLDRRRHLVGCSLRFVRRDVLVGRGDRFAALADGIAVHAGKVHTWEMFGLYEIEGSRIRRCWQLPLGAEVGGEASS